MTLEDESDESLWARWRDGDKTAHEVLARRYLSIARQYATRYRTNNRDGDALGEAQLALTMALASYNPSRGMLLSQYIQLTLHNRLAHKPRRRAYATIELPECMLVASPTDNEDCSPLDQVPTSAPPPDEAALDSLQAATLWSALDDLTRTEALILKLRFRHGYSAREIAALLGVSEARISQIVAALMQKLRQVVHAV